MGGCCPKASTPKSCDDQNPPNEPNEPAKTFEIVTNPVSSNETEGSSSDNEALEHVSSDSSLSLTDSDKEEAEMEDEAKHDSSSTDSDPWTEV